MLEEMHIKKCLTIIFLLTCYSLIVSSGSAAARVALEISDCSKCHPKEVASIGSKGERHRTAVSCLDCHDEHPPWGENVIPTCSNCHTGRVHFDLENCLSCHADPHKPLVLTLAEDITVPCLTCHGQQGEELQDFPSGHSEQSCTFCHAEKHGIIPDCAQCHEPHAQGQVTNDCLGCHPVHKPLQIEAAITTPRKFCVACHEEIGPLMDLTTTKHQNFTCTFCHRGMHPFVPKCQMCHGEPHSSVMHDRMPNCIDCHLDPHNLAK